MLRNPSRLHRTAAGLALIAAPLMSLIADILSVGWADDTAEYVSEVAGNPGAQAWSGVFYVIGFTLIVPGVIGIVHLIRGRGTTLAHIGGGLAVIGLGAFPALAVTSVFDAAAVESIGQADYVALLDGLEDQAAAIVLLVIILVPALLSLLIIGAAVWRSGLAPWWAALALIVSGLMLAASGSSQVLNIVSDIFLLVGLGYLGLRMLRMTDAEWDRPPERWNHATPSPQSGDL